MQHQEPTSKDVAQRRVIKRYSNRKLYDTKGSQYVTLLQIADMVRAGEEVQVIDNSTKEDKTEVTLALIISEELKARPRGIPLAMLKELIHSQGERILTTLRDGPIGKLMPKEEGETNEDASGAEDPADADSSRKEPRGQPVPVRENTQPKSNAAQNGTANTASRAGETALEQEVRALSERVRVLEELLSARTE